MVGSLIFYVDFAAFMEFSKMDKNIQFFGSDFESSNNNFYNCTVREALRFCEGFVARLLWKIYIAVF